MPVYKDLPKKRKKKPDNVDKDLGYLWADPGPYEHIILSDTSNGMPFVVGTAPDAEDAPDTNTISSYSTMATMDDNPGTGRFIDKHVYQPLGRKIERLFARILRPGHDALAQHPPDVTVELESTSSFSTNATEDDIPGPGRTIDKYLYQRFGRKVENFAFRITFSSLSPGQILQYFIQKTEPDVRRSSSLPDVSTNHGTVLQLDYIIHTICEENAPWGQPFVAGLKSLVKQSK